nr:replication-relaxation family protein [Salinispora arenicola]
MANGIIIDLAAHERTHPGTSLAVWRPASAYHEPSAFFCNGSDLKLVGAATGLPRPDGAGVWMQDGTQSRSSPSTTPAANASTCSPAKLTSTPCCSPTPAPGLGRSSSCCPSVLREQHWHDRLSTAYLRWLSGDHRHHRR